MGIFLLTLILLSWAAWRVYHGPDRGFLPRFAKLLDRPEFVDSFETRMRHRFFLKGEFRGRQVVVMQDYRRAICKVVVSMETHGGREMESYDFTGYRPTREAEMAVYAIEVKHDLRMVHRDSTIKVMWETFIPHPSAFNPAKWQNVLDAMHTLAASLDTQAA